MDAHVALELADRRARIHGVDERLHRLVAAGAEKRRAEDALAPFLKIHVEEGSERILGAALLGTGCDEAVQSLVDAVYARTPIGKFQRHVRIHPTVAELLPTTVESLKPL